MNYIIIGQRRNGELEKLEEYLSLKKKNFLSIGFDNYLQKKNEIKIEEYVKGKSKTKKLHKFFYIDSKNKIITLINFFILFLFIIFKIKKLDNSLAIGVSLFPTIICYILKLQNKVKNFVYYNQDYYLPEKNLSSIIYCKIFQIFDHYLYLKCFKAWNSSIRLDSFRTKIPLKKKIGKTFILTNGFFNNFDETEKYNVHSNSICFVGTLSENQKILALIDCVKKLRKTKKDLKLDIIGMGPLYKKLEDKIYQENMSDYIILHGFVDDLKLLRSLISKSVLCYCVYNKNDIDNSNIASTGKLSLYTSIRRPTILSEHLVLTRYYRRFNCGLITNSETDDIYDKIKEKYQQNKTHLDYRKTVWQSF
jgi:glycosyltransferase involved in cell wall biosynthesis